MTDDNRIRKLFDTYYNYVYAIVYRQIQGIGTREDVEECVSDVFIDVLRTMDSVQTSSLQVYIGKTARNKAIDVCRSLTAGKNRRLPIDDVPEPQSPQDVPADAEDAEQRRLLFQAVKQLGEPDASIIIHKYYYGRSAIEIGRILGMNPVTVRSRCARALRKLRELTKDIR
jgi:RNA polymerase sigma-70 factor (ECF subfamily)